jgi:hypothetical protein
MAVIRINKTADYTIMGNCHLREKEMSLKAKGLMSLMLSLPNDWDYSVAGLVSICKESDSSIKSALDELKKYGYLVITKKMPNQTDSGKIEYEYNNKFYPSYEYYKLIDKHKQKIIRHNQLKKKCKKVLISLLNSLIGFIIINLINI